jgi:hypothetical protein
MYFCIKNLGEVFLTSVNPFVPPKYAPARESLVKDTFAERYHDAQRLEGVVQTQAYHDLNLF